LTILDFGIWILDLCEFGFLIGDSGIFNFGFWEFGF